MPDIITPEPFDLFMNSGPVRAEPYGRRGRADILSLAGLERAKAEITTWPGYGPTTLHRLPGLAAAAGIAQLLYKDEGSRFGLGSFKALGGAYAVLSLLQDEIGKTTGRRPSSSDLASGNLRDLTSMFTVACATDGNHGKSVAWGAQVFGCRCVIYVHEKVSQGRRDAIAAYGAEVREAKGTYDDAVRLADEDARAHGWRIVSDTSYDGYTEIPRRVMQGYAMMPDEAFAQLGAGERPTHVFVQGGVGGLAAAVCSYLWERLGTDAPMFVVVEPDKADCLIRSARAGKPVAAVGDLDTIMAGLACGEASLIAWEILQPGTDAFMTVSDSAAAETMKLLSDGRFGDDPIVAGESAVAGLAGFLLASRDAEARRKLRIDGRSVVMVFGTEGATDPELYERIVGRSVADVQARRVESVRGGAA